MIEATERDVRALVARAATGDPDAWEAVYRRSYARLFAYARRRMPSDHAADDAVSETMVRALNRINPDLSVGSRVGCRVVAGADGGRRVRWRCLRCALKQDSDCDLGCSAPGAVDGAGPREHCQARSGRACTRVNALAS